MTSSQIHDAILCLKCHIEDVLSSCKVFISAPVLRLDNGKAAITLKHLANKMKNVNNVIFHENMDRGCLGGKGLHLSPRGSGRLVINYLSQIRRL